MTWAQWPHSPFGGVRGINAFTLAFPAACAKRREARCGPLNTVVWLKSWRTPRARRAWPASWSPPAWIWCARWPTHRTPRALPVPWRARHRLRTDAAHYGADCALTSTTFELGPVYVELVRQYGPERGKAEICSPFRGRSRGAGPPFARPCPKGRREGACRKGPHEAGEDVSFAGPVFDQTGKERIAAGAKATDQE